MELALREREIESESEWLTHKFDVIRAQQTKNQPKLSYDPAHNLTHKEINKTNCRFVILLSSLHAYRPIELIPNKLCAAIDFLQGTIIRMLFVSFSRLNDGNVFHQTFCSLWNVVAIHLAGTEIDGTIYVIIECWWLDVSCYRFSFHIFTNGSVSQTSNKQWFWTMFPIAIETRLFTIPRCPKIDWMDFSNWNNTLSSIRSCQKSGFCGFKKKTFSSDSKLLLIHVITFCRTFEFPFQKRVSAGRVVVVAMLTSFQILFRLEIETYLWHVWQLSREKKTRYETKSQSKF